MPSRRTHTIAPGAPAMRADKALAAAFPAHSRAALQRAFDAGLVSRGGVALARDAAVRGGDVIAFSMPPAKPPGLAPAKIPLDVLFEDKHMLAINKPSGMVAHPGAATRGDTLVHALLAHCKGSLSGIGGVERPGIVHRLDRETSGVMVVAKTDAAHRTLAAQFAARSPHKAYLALVGGAPALLSGSVARRIGRHPAHRHKMMAFDDSNPPAPPTPPGRHPPPRARDARTDWEVVERYGKIAALVRCVLHTGRTHQIRVHMKSLGHILLGDAVYGWKPDARIPEKSQPGRVMLHAARLALAHPVSGTPLDLRAPPPKDFKAMIKTLKTAAGM